MDALNHAHFGRYSYQRRPVSAPFRARRTRQHDESHRNFCERSIDDKYNCCSRICRYIYIYIYLYIHTYIAVVTLIQILNIVVPEPFFRLWKFHPEQTDHGAERTAQGKCGRSPWMFLRSPLTVVGFLIVCRFLRSRCLCVRMTVMTR